MNMRELFAEREFLPDECDRAAVLQMLDSGSALAKHVSGMHKPLDPDFDGKHCIECDAGIPEGRIAIMQYTVPANTIARPHKTDKVIKKSDNILRHGTDHCVSCADMKHKKNKQFARQ